jgi:hypothetical protein
VREKNSWLSSPKRIHPSIFRESVHPSTLPAFSFVRRAKHEETGRTFFGSSFRFVQSVLDRSRARETRRGSVRVRHLVGRNFLQPFNQRRRTPTSSSRERRALGTNDGGNKRSIIFFFLFFFIRASFE